MIFQEYINESYDIEYNETSEIEDPVLKLIDKDNKSEHRFYTEDVEIIRKFLNRIDRFKESEKLKPETLYRSGGGEKGTA